MSYYAALIEKLRQCARQSSAAQKLIADAKTARNRAAEGEPAGGPGYGWALPEQTIEWQAADAIEALTREPIERIVRTAVRHGDAIYSLPSPARHGHILHDMPVDIAGGVGPEDQGFLTSTGRFVDRAVGWHIAKDAKQLICKHVGPDGMLFSEDLW